jgi:hypothetical protein
VASAATSALAAGWYRSSGCAHVLFQVHHARLHWTAGKPPGLRLVPVGMLAGQIHDCLIYVGGSTRHDAIVMWRFLERESRDADI